MALSFAKLFIRNSTAKFSFPLEIQNLKASYRTCKFSSLSRGILLDSKQLLNTRSLFLSGRWMKESVTIVFLKDDGAQVVRKGQIGDTIQQLVVFMEDPEIENFGVCGGNAQCGTCRVIFPKKVFDKLEPPDDVEESLLSYQVENDCETLRLGCQVKLTKELDGVVLRVPAIELHSDDEE